MTIKLSAPAKINLTLEVLGKRDDGFHEIRSIIQTVDLCDTLHFESADKVDITSSLSEWKAEESLVYHAVRIVQAAASYSSGVKIRVEKRIPLMSGMGGDSSDAATVLLGLNRLWELHLSREKLLQLGGQLGSDVSFFLSGGTALLEGRGEQVVPLPDILPERVVLAVPPVKRMSGKTGLLYSSLKPEHFTDGGITRKLQRELESGRDIEPSLLFNTFENVAYDIFPGLSISRYHFKQIAGGNVHLAGSGPALFTLVKDKKRADDLCSLLLGQQMDAHVVKTLPVMDNTD